MLLNVWNPDSGASGKYKFRVFVKSNMQLKLIEPRFESPIEYSIRGPASCRWVPLYNAAQENLEFFLKSIDESKDLPGFLKVGRDE